MIEKIEQRHRDKAAASLMALKGSDKDAKMIAVCEKIKAGEADDHPSVQGAAFYETPPA